MHTHFKKYQALLSSLRRGPTAYGIAPHKPVLLLSLIDRIEQGHLQENHIPIDSELFGLFRSNWKKLVATQNVRDITLPLYHLSDGLGWTLVGKNGEKIEHKLSSQLQIVARVGYGQFDPAFFHFLQSQENRDLARIILLDTYFPQTKANYLQEKSLPAYVLEIEQSIVEEGGATYRKYTREIEGYVRDWKFRVAVMEAYQFTCCMSRLHLEPDFSLIQACHIVPHASSGLDHITNGLALCANLHVAFDHGLVSLSDHFEILIQPKVKETDSPYNIHQLKGQQILLPASERFYPRLDYLRWHREEYGF